LILRAGIRILAQDLELAETARNAFVSLRQASPSRGTQLGDCAAYAVAKSRDVPLLFRGDDFSKTDVAAAST
jgi:ribonuclease VapC